MNSSAKITASFLAAAALGAAVIFTGCTVGSGTVDDVDGGTQTGDTGAPTGDGGADTGPVTPGTCTTGLKKPFSNVAECESCLADKCCTPQQTCAAVVVAGDAGTLNCDDYDECILDCVNGADDKFEECVGLCDSLVDPAVKTAYGAIETCAETNCSTQCVPGAPDGG